jgi:5-methylcytosine-specific restriction endonuclease McrA
LAGLSVAGSTVLCMSEGVDREYGADAYSPDDVLWWRLKMTPGTKRPFGDEQKISAYLACHVGREGIFTMKDLRAALGEDAFPNSAEHLNRRLRNLRLRDKWVIPSAKDDGNLAHDQYQVRVIGWHPGTGLPRPKNDAPSESTRRKVLARDKSVCQVCFTPGGEPYADLPEKLARLTLGHRVPGKRLDSTATVDDLQTECARCNESVRDELFDPVTLPEVLPILRMLRRQDKKTLLLWIESGGRSPSRVEQAFADFRRLSQTERDTATSVLRRMVGDPAPGSS